MRKWLYDIRSTQLIRQTDLSKKVGIAQSYYSDIENGKTGPSVKVAKKIGLVLGFNWTKFFEEGSEESANEHNA